SQRAAISGRLRGNTKGPAMDDPAPPHPSGRPPRHRWLGGLIAFGVLAGLAALAWYLTRPVAPAVPGAASSAVDGRAAPGAGGPRPGGRGGPATTVGVATAEQADVPVWLDALGTVTPSATVTVRPQV